MTKTITKIGDVFSVEISSATKKYFQYIANDLTQLNSDVIRAFKIEYPLHINPDIKEIIEAEIDFYAHCVTKWGVKLGFWKKSGNDKNVGVSNIWFRDTNDYGTKIGEPHIMVSHNWHVWKINEPFINIGSLSKEYQDAYIGLVINPKGIIELLKGNKYPVNYPGFE